MYVESVLLIKCVLDKVCGDKVCVEKVFVDKVYGDKVWRRAEEEKAAEEEPGIQNQKQEPHTKMWGKTILLTMEAPLCGVRSYNNTMLRTWGSSCQVWCHSCIYRLCSIVHTNIYIYMCVCRYARKHQTVSRV